MAVRGLEIVKKVFGEEHLQYAAGLELQANVYEATPNKSAQAKQLRKRSKEIRKRVLGR